jgi:hypothetical protein
MMTGGYRWTIDWWDAFDVSFDMTLIAFGKNIGHKSRLAQSHFLRVCLRLFHQVRKNSGEKTASTRYGPSIKPIPLFCRQVTGSDTPDISRGKRLQSVQQMAL